ncbi:MAG: LuxR C-terminal-related transcriptional regulator [Dehalococcoidia bacterium]
MCDIVEATEPSLTAEPNSEALQRLLGTSMPGFPSQPAATERPTVAGSAGGAAGPPVALSAREADVLRLLAAGHSNTEIAAALVLSRRTAEHHVANIYQKLGVAGPSARIHAAVYAFQHGIATPR